MKHIPVLMAEVLAALKPKKGHVVVDCTLGLGGHSAELLDLGVRVIGLDLDPANLKEAQERFEVQGGDFSLHHANFAGLPKARLSIATKAHYATVRKLGAGGLPGSGPATVLQSGWSATTYLQWWNWCRRTTPRIVLTLPRRAGTLRFRPHDTPRCAARSKVTTLVVTPFRK